MSVIFLAKETWSWLHSGYLFCQLLLSISDILVPELRADFKFI